MIICNQELTGNKTELMYHHRRKYWISAFVPNPLSDVVGWMSVKRKTLNTVEHSLM